MKLRLQSKTTLTIALLVVAILTASSYLFYDTATRALDTEMGERLVAVAQTSAALLNGSYLRALEPGSENTRLYQTLQKKLQSMRDAAEARAIYVLDFENRSLLDSRPNILIGSTYHSLGEDRVHIDQAKKGIGAASIAFRGKDDAFYRSAYAPIRDEQGTIVAILAVDASILFLETLSKMGRNMILIGGLGITLAIILSIFLARSIVVPIKKLSRAAEQIKAGAFGTQVEEYGKDEVGALAETFNEMSLAIEARDYQVSRLADELRLMSAGLAHEVRNPLNGMRIFLGLLKRQIPADPKAEQLIEQVDGEVHSLNELVTEFLDFARPKTFQPQAVNVSKVVDSVLSLLDSELRAGDDQIQTLNLDTLPTIQADSDQLKWVFTNLFKNAAHAVSQGGTVAVEGFAAENNVCIEVRDTGVGMSAETAERAFTPFFSTKDTGTGLGLAVVKRLIQNHRGSIECTSKEGRGTTFTIKLPIWGYPFNRSYHMFSAWRILALASTTRARLASFKPGFEPMRTAWTTSNGCGGPTASSVRVAATKAVGAWAMAASCVRRVRHAVR